MSYVVPETRLRGPLLLIATGLPLSVRVSVLAPKLLGLTGMLNLTARFETGCFEGSA